MTTSTAQWILAIGMIASGCNLCLADDWPQFLGASRNGTSAEKGLISVWPTAGPEILWKTPLGVGMSGISVVGDHAFTMYQDDENQFVAAMKVSDGSIAWQTPVAPAYSNAMGHGPRATPTISGDSVVTYSGEGVLASLNKDSGKLNWKVDVPKELGGKPSEYGMSCSPLVVGEWIVVHSGTRQAAVAAFRLSDGKRAWKAGQGTAGYSSPVLMTLNNAPTVVAFVGASVLGIDPATGNTLWSYEYVTDYDCNTASPVQLSSDTVLISAGENHGSTVLKISGSPASGQKAAPVWKSPGKDSQLRAEWQTPVIHNGHLYALDNIGSAGPITNLVCIRLSDMKTTWQKNRFGKSNLTLADGKLFMTDMDGELMIVEATPSAFTLLSKSEPVIETTRQAPAISDGRLYVRDDKTVVCVKVK
ncbi:MAG: PQQ-binding-like beta-propeller repeat protein [Planctomycetaceae bacterium]|nr:PQQ-binding-like beta-propeller repeat protein [Planctomycetaceae bacterium]